MFPSKEENCIVVVNRKSSTEFLSDIEPLTEVVHITFKRAVTLISTPFVAFTASVADIMLVASRGETFLVEVRKIKRNAASIGVTKSLNFFIERHNQ